jgi:hypothetical protein
MSTQKRRYPREIRVFFASPSDLSEERRKFRDVIRNLNVGFGDGLGVGPARGSPAVPVRECPSGESWVEVGAE